MRCQLERVESSAVSQVAEREPAVDAFRQDVPSPVVIASGLARRFGEVEAVRGVSFTISEGEVFGFLGPNG